MNIEVGLSGSASSGASSGYTGDFTVKGGGGNTLSTTMGQASPVKTTGSGISPWLLAGAGLAVIGIVWWIFRRKRT
jgi:LPXTG-motif cell wall-anchored protein